MAKTNALMWLASAISEARGQPVPGRREILTPAGVKHLEQEMASFLAEVGAQPSPANAEKLAVMAAGARAQARRDKSEATAYLAFAVRLETLVRAIGG